MIDPSDIIKANEIIVGRAKTVLDLSMVHSALSAYFYYDEIWDKVSSIVRGLIKNHPFIEWKQEDSCQRSLLSGGQT